MQCEHKKVVASVYIIAAVIAMAVLIMLPFRKERRTLDNGPLIQNVSTNGFTVVWWREAHGEGHLRVLGSGTAKECFVAVRRTSRYEARGAELESGTTYRYEIVHTDTEGAEHLLYAGQAATAKPPGSAFSFMVFANSGSGKHQQYHLARVMGEYPADLILHAGDLVYRKGEFNDYHKKFFCPYRHLINHISFYPVLGNHDVRTDDGSPFLETFSLPTNGPPSVQAERCYWFDYGDARFVGIDSTLDREMLSGAVAPWLRAVLDASNATWKFVYFHHPPWAGGNYPSDAKIRDTLVPTIEAADVDVVFCGHNHLYRRTHPILEGRIAPSNGVVYITSGAAGKTLHKEQSADAPHLAAFNDTLYSFTWVNVSGSHLELMQISKGDDILDKVAFIKNDRNELREVRSE